MKCKSFPIQNGQNYFSPVPPDDLSQSLIRLTGLLLVLRVTGHILEVLILFLLGNSAFTADTSKALVSSERQSSSFYFFMSATTLSDSAFTN